MGNYVNGQQGIHSRHFDCVGVVNIEHNRLRLLRVQEYQKFGVDLWKNLKVTHGCELTLVASRSCTFSGDSGNIETGLCSDVHGDATGKHP